MIDISNCPAFSDVKRKVKLIEAREQPLGKFITYWFKVFYFDLNDNDITSTFASKTVPLRADNTTLIDFRDGSYADENTPKEFQEGEYTFFKNRNVFTVFMVNSLNALDALIVARADSLNRFD